MKNNHLIILVLISLTSCQLNWYGDIDLGSDFFYIVDPAFNSIVIPVNKGEPYTSSIYIIKDIESIGINRKWIFAASMTGEKLNYWHIDKSKKIEKLGYNKNSILKLSNVLEIDSVEFYQKIRIEHISLKTKTDYRKELNYE